jgi:hypothetical protein
VVLLRYANRLANSRKRPPINLTHQVRHEVELYRTVQETSKGMAEPQVPISYIEEHDVHPSVATRHRSNMLVYTLDGDEIVEVSEPSEKPQQLGS